MMRNGILFFAAGALSMTLWEGSAEAQSSRSSRATAPTGSCYALWVSSPTPDGPDGPDRKNAPPRRRHHLEFSSQEVLDLEFLVLVPLKRNQPSLAGRKVELKLFTPKGHLYQTLSMNKEPSDPQATSKRRRRYDTVTATLPVAGTTIVNNSLYGTWKAEAYVEGEAVPCAKSRSFEIQP